MFWNQRRRSTNHDFRAEQLKAQHVGQCHPAVPDVAKNAHTFPGQAPQPLSEGKAIQQSLCGMLMGAIPSIHNGHLNLLCQIMCRTRVWVAHDDHVDLHGQNVANGVRQGLPFLDTR